jgi:hypothetical protein
MRLPSWQVRAGGSSRPASQLHSSPGLRPLDPVPWISPHLSQLCHSICRGVGQLPGATAQEVRLMNTRLALLHDLTHE